MIIVNTKKTSEVGRCEACTVPSKFVTLVELNSVQFRICDLCKNDLMRELGAVVGKNYGAIDEACDDIVESVSAITDYTKEAKELVEEIKRLIRRNK